MLFLTLLSDNKQHLFNINSLWSRELICGSSLMEEVLEAVILGGGADDRDEIGPPEPPFNLNNLTDQEVVSNFRFERRDLPSLRNVLNLPEIIVTEAGDRVEGLQALLIVLKRMAYPCRLADLQSFFNISPQSISQIIKSTIGIILREKGNLLEDLNNLEWLNRKKLVQYAEAIHNKGGAINNCWSFIDGTARPICRPSINQQDYYSGHKKCHCLKYQSVLCPDGIIASFIGAYPGRRHDAAILRESNLYQQLEQKAVFGENDKFVIYGDQGYGLLELLITPFPGAPDNMPPHHLLFNQSMETLRVAVEWGFSKNVTLFAFIDFKKIKNCYYKN